MKVFLVDYDPYRLRQELIVADNLDEAKLLVEKDSGQRYYNIEIGSKDLNRILSYFYSAKKSLEDSQEVEASGKLSESIERLLVFDINRATEIVQIAHEKTRSEKQIIIDNLIEKVKNLVPVNFTFQQTIELCFIGITQ